MENTNEEMPEFIGDINVDYYKAYFGDNFDYYSTLILTQKANKSFNFYAFFFGGFWLLYRRLYYVFIALMAIMVIESLIQDWIVNFFKITSGIVILINFIVAIIGAIVIGKIGDYYLIKHAQRKISKITHMYENNDIRIEKIRKSGAGNWLIFIIIFLSIIFIAFISTIF
jgi:hypothetical protein